MRKNVFRMMFISIFSSYLCSCTQESDRGVDADITLIEEVSFQNDIEPIFKESCQSCHGDVVANGAFEGTEFVDKDYIISWASPIVSQLEQELMPPIGTSMLSGEDRQLLIDWLIHKSSQSANDVASSSDDRASSSDEGVSSSETSQAVQSSESISSSSQDLMSSANISSSFDELSSIQVNSSNTILWGYSDPEVKNIFDKYCIECHTGVTARKQIKLDTYANITANPSIISLIESTVIINKTMPGAGASNGSLSDQELAILSEWIQQGALE